MAGGQRFAGLLVTVVDVNTLGLKAAQGLVLTEGWYWDMNDANREWTRRWQVMRPGKFPTMSQAGIYPSVLHYLKVVAAADGRAVVAKMKEMPTDDPLFDKGYIRADGSGLFEVKKPEESKYPGDDYNLLARGVPTNEGWPVPDGPWLMTDRWC
jgi:branched-chain amino acid transport system substrate-binding protein